MSIASHKREFARAMAAARWTKPATLVVVTKGARDSGDVTGGRPETETSVPCKGLVVSWKGSRFQGIEVTVKDRVVHLVAQSLGSTTPKLNDKVTIESVTGRIIALDRDGAAAVWMCLVRG